MTKSLKNVNYEKCTLYDLEYGEKLNGCPGTHFVDQAGLELKNQPVSASTSQVLGLKACATTARLNTLYLPSELAWGNTFCLSFFPDRTSRLPMTAYLPDNICE